MAKKGFLNNVKSSAKKLAKKIRIGTAKAFRKVGLVKGGGG